MDFEFLCRSTAVCWSVASYLFLCIIVAYWFANVTFSSSTETLRVFILRVVYLNFRYGSFVLTMFLFVSDTIVSFNMRPYVKVKWTDRRRISSILFFTKYFIFFVKLSWCEKPFKSILILFIEVILSNLCEFLWISFTNPWNDVLCEWVRLMSVITKTAQIKRQ